MHNLKQHNMFTKRQKYLDTTQKLKLEAHAGLKSFKFSKGLMGKFLGTFWDHFKAGRFCRLMGVLQGYMSSYFGTIQNFIF